MRVLSIAAFVATLTASLACAQVQYDLTPYVPRVTVATGYQFVQSNAPPAMTNYFRSNGGFLSAGYTVRYWLRGVAQVTGSHATTIGPLGQNLTLLTYTAGPEIVLHARRFEPYAQALFGAAQGRDSYFPSTDSYSTSATSFAYQLGGGIDYNWSHHLSIRAVEARYMHTGFPNGTNNAQSHLMLGAGVVFKFGGSLWVPDPGHERAKANKAMQKSEQAARNTSFAAAAPAATPVAPPPTNPSPSAAQPADSGGVFGDRVKDALFDYDSYALRPDAVAVLEQDAAYLKLHSELQVRVGGYSDERGTAEYNLALGEKRAQAVRDALVAHGVSSAQLDVISYGKEVQICTAENEACFQQNRRAGFEPRR